MVQVADRSLASSSLLVRLTRMGELLDQVDPLDYRMLSADQAQSVAVLLRELNSRLSTHVGMAVRAVQATTPARTSPQVISGGFGNDTHAVLGEIKTARVLESASVSERAAADGVISHRHATVIAKALQDLPGNVTVEQRERCEQQLLRDAQTLSPRDLEVRGRRITDQYKPTPKVDEDEDALLRRREARAWANTRFSMWDKRDGTWGIDATLPELAARQLKTILDAITAPRRAHLEPGVEGESLQQRMGHAFTGLVESLPTDHLPTTGGTPARVIITINEESLRSRVAAATLDTGERISAGETRRLACTHGILPMILNSDSVPIDLGRTQRLFNTHQRTALAVMDHGCAAPGCDRPAPWCEAHHPHPWEAGGHTNLDNAVLLCSAHHHQAHQHNWRIRRHNGQAEINTGNGWQRNHRYRP
ncbi:MAG: DUF222 domain-containing protein [Gordonia sp. (in: high G+C Gram-positive bacteria)]